LEKYTKVDLKPTVDVLQWAIESCVSLYLRLLQEQPFVNADVTEV
jgi:hypothetical protein